MKKVVLFFIVSLVFSTGLFGVGERVLGLGAASGWNTAPYRQGITEVYLARPYPVLALFAQNSGEKEGADMVLSFDEDGPGRFADRTGHYQVQITAQEEGGIITTVGRPLARIGTGAAQFSGPRDPLVAFRGDGPLVLFPRSRALFSAGNQIRDFSIEFWIYPTNMENGEQILSWISVKDGGRGAFQRIQCETVKNRLQWTFTDFFTAPNGRTLKSLTLSSSPVLPRAWSHHLIRFDADLGLLEYLVDGHAEAIAHTTDTAHEGGEVFIPHIGQDGRFVLGNRFTGLIDEFQVRGSYLERPNLVKYSPQGGRVETIALDLGEENSRVLKVDAFGGRASSVGGILRNEYAGNRTFRFSDDSALHFFIRVGDLPYAWTDDDWLPFIPGKEFPDSLNGPRGRFVQLAAVFYPSGDGETTPYLDEFKITYKRNDPPLPPANVTAFARDGAVDLYWKASADDDLTGYLVYYGISQGEYFGDNDILEPSRGFSPIDVGKRTSIRIEGLKNGTLYYFVVAAYRNGNPPKPGEFSRETSARPLRGL